VQPCTTRSVIGKGTEDESVITGYRRNIVKTSISHIAALVLCGIPYLFARWKPRWRLEATCSVCYLAQADRLLVLHCEARDEVVVRVEEEEVGPAFPSKFTVANNQQSTGDTDRLLEDSSLAFRYFTYRHLRYGWNSGAYSYELVSGLDKGTGLSDISEKFSKGLSEGVSPLLLQLHGLNSIAVEIPSILSLLVEEVLHPFYIFQICSITLWSMDNYYYYAFCILTISLISVAVSLYETRRQAESLHEMVSAGGGKECRVLRGGEELDLDVAQLVPGDLIVLDRAGCNMSCDAVLLTGTAIVNEAMLTGESVPVTKAALPPCDESSDEIYSPEMHKRHTIFAGTQVIQTRFYGDQQVLAVVVRTGFQTSKGELIRSILFPRPMDFKFYRDSVRFILVLFSIAAIGMVYCVYLYVARGSDISMIILRTLDIITIVVPPALPAAMTVGTVYAQSRLKRQGIFCISPGRINVCGKLKLVCFDKTGTLTEDGLNLKSVIPVRKDKSGFQDQIEDVASISEDSPLMWSLASCHSLTVINNTLTGDPLDAQMFEGTGWELEEPGEDTSNFDKMMPTVVRPGSSQLFSLDSLPLELGIIRQFTFSSSLARMSVIVKELSSTNFIVFTKGAPEKLEDICTPESIPSDFHSKLKELTLQGLRVIALAYKPLPHNLNWIKIQKIKRDQVENDLIFLGFLVMQNTLKPQTKGVIRELRAAELKIVMITGDNLLTGISVSRDSGIVDPEDRVVILEVKHRGEMLCVEFQDAEGTRMEDTHQSKQETAVNVTRKSHLAVTGKAWSLLVKHFPDLVPRVLVQGTVFARMSPDQKAHLVEELQTQGYIVSMCGDGANDCGALKAAHVGVSLSEAEASVAAPFTSKIPNISCIPKLILEGRCSLVTSFGVFKYMALYSMIQFISVLILYTNFTNLGDTQFLYIDLVITTTVAVLMGRTEAWTVLVKKRPPGSLVSGQTLTSIMFQILASLAGQVAAVLYLQTKMWYTPIHPDDPDAEIIVDPCTTTVFIVSSFQYLVIATLYSTGPPYRKPFYTNLVYLAAVLLLSGFTFYLLFIPAMPFPFVQDIFQLDNIPAPFKLELLTLILLNLVLNILLEVAVTSGTWVKKLSHFITRKKRPKNQYKLVLRDLALEPSWPENGQTYTAIPNS